MSSSFYVEMAFNMGKIGADLAAHLDEVAAAFAHVKEVDGDVAVDTGTGRVTLCMTLDAATRYDAVGIALTAARTAIHSAGGATPGWEDMLARLLDTEEYQLSSIPSSWAPDIECLA